jgi:hypothetical protein
MMKHMAYSVVDTHHVLATSLASNHSSIGSVPLFGQEISSSTTWHTYDGKDNPEQWITLYEIAVQAAHDDEDVMANYFPVVINQSANQWLLSLREGSINTWAQLRRAFIDNYMATCQQPGNKYDLEKVRDYPNESLRDYIRRFSETQISIPNINNDEAISAFIRGLRHHDALRTKLLRKRPDSVQDLLTVAKKWADADEANEQIKEDVGWAPHPDQQNHCSDDRWYDRCRDDRRDDRCNDNHDHHNDNRDRRRQDDFKGRQSHNRPADNVVNAVKPGAKRNYEDAYSKVFQGPCPAHPGSSHIMGNCRGLKSIYRLDARKRQRGKDKDGDKDDRQDDNRHDEEDKAEEHDKDPHHAYKDPDRSVHNIFGGKVALENR